MEQASRHGQTPRSFLCQESYCSSTGLVMILQRLWSDFPSGELLAVSGGSVRFHCVQDTHDQQGGNGILHSKGEADKWLGFLAAFTWVSTSRTFGLVLRSFCSPKQSKVHR